MATTINGVKSFIKALNGKHENGVAKIRILKLLEYGLQNLTCMFPADDVMESGP